MKKTFKEAFEESYGEGSFNDDFLVTATSAEGVHNKIHNTHGGNRPNSGRKASNKPTTTINFRIPTEDKAKLKKLPISTLFKEWYKGLIK